MFSSLGLFQNTPCPELASCKRPRCIFSHRSDLPPPPGLIIPVQQSIASSSNTRIDARPASSKFPSIPSESAQKIHERKKAQYNIAGSSTGEPARKLQRVGPTKRPIAVPTASSVTTGVPTLRVNAAQSQVAIPVRQAMLKNVYEHFAVLYRSILHENPTLASEHALKQEQQVYEKSTKLTYRNAVIQSIAGIKRREIPTSISHPSVGTEADIIARSKAYNALAALHLTRSHLEPLVLSMSELEKWGYIISIPDGPGGSQPSKEGMIAQCERCCKSYTVDRNASSTECIYHLKRAYFRTIGGERTKIYECCGRPLSEPDACTRGPHVFYETKAEDLHLRHAFSFLRAPKVNDTALDVVALDCEMVYTTGGMRVARVSVVDGAGQEIFDEMVKMDEGVEIVDFITQFSGISQESYNKAILPLDSIRQALDRFINSETILIGHSLDSDLKTLRIIHHRCIDTALLFPHPAGHPYRKALRDLARQHLDITIQAGGGTVGHSSVEDSVATLDLVKWHVLNTHRTKS